MKGSARGFGFPELQTLGASIETHAKAADAQALGEDIRRLAEFLAAHASDKQPSGA